MNTYKLFADPAVEGNFFIRSESGVESKRSWPYAMAYEIQGAMDVAFEAGAIQASIAGGRTAAQLMEVVMTENAREAIKTLDLIALIAKSGDADSIVKAVAVNKESFEKYLASRQPVGPKSNQE